MTPPSRYRLLILLTAMQNAKIPEAVTVQSNQIVGGVMPPPYAGFLNKGKAQADCLPVPLEC